MQHLNPILVLLIEYGLNPWLFSHVHVLFLLMMSAVYIPVNYIGTKVKKEPIYDILSWEDWKTLYFLIAIVGLCVLSFHVFTFISKLRVTKENLESIIINMNAEGSTSLLVNTIDMS